MKKIIYDRYGHESIEYEITDAEFKEASVVWSTGMPYWCKRLQAMLSSKFNFCETPEQHKMYAEIYIHPETKREFGVVLDKKGKEVFYEIFENPDHDHLVEGVDIRDLKELDIWMAEGSWPNKLIEQKKILALRAVEREKKNAMLDEPDNQLIADKPNATN